MNRNTALTIGLALLAVVAVSFAAATLDTATTGGGGSGVGPGPRQGPGMGQNPGGDVRADEGSSGNPVPASLPCFPFLTNPLVVAGIVLAFLLATFGAYRLTGSYVISGTFLVAIGTPALFLHAFLTSCTVPAAKPSNSTLPPQGNASSLLPAGGGGSGLNQSGQVVSTPAAALGVVLLLALVGSVFLLFFSTGDDEELPPASDEGAPAPAPDVAAIGRAAGEAADRIEEDADLQNEVYRAWTQMTELLDLDRPRSSTPGEFAAAAVDAGMAREDVAELTSLFESVRYGGASVTAEREQRAIDALRRIEAEYADGAGTDAGDDSSPASRGDE